MKKIIIAVVFLVSLGLLIFGGGTALAGPSSYETAWSPAMNQASYWSNTFGMECKKYENHSGYISENYDAAVIKDGSSVVKVYPDLSNTGNFTATGAINPNNGKPYSAPHSWVMKCDAPQPPTTTEPPVTVPPTTEPPVTTPPTTEPPVTTPPTTEPPVTTPPTTEPPTTEPPTTEPPVTTTPETTEPPIVCIDTFDNDLQDPNDPCGPPTTVEDCTTGVINELGVCEPVGTPGELPEPTPPATPIMTELPATGTEATVMAWIAAALLMGGLVAWSIARRDS